MIYIESGAANTDKPVALYENLFLDGTLTGSDVPDFPKENAITGSTWDFWMPEDGDVRSIVVTLPSSDTANCAFIDAHELGTNGADFKIQYSTDGGLSWLDITNWTTVTDDSPIMVIFPATSGDAWRIRQRNGPAKVGVVMIGDALSFEFGIDNRYTGFKHAKRTEVMGGNSLGGQFLGQKVRRKGGNTSVEFPLLTAGFIDNTMAMFEEHYNDGKPFAFASRPDYAADELAYCWRPDGASELRPTYFELGKYANFTMSVDYYVQS